MKKKDLSFVVIFIVIVTISLMYLAQASYAKYRRQVNGDVEATIARWNITVNNELINNKTALTNFIIPTLDTNQYVKSGVLAPGGTGYFDIIINATDVDVDFDYTINGEINQSTPLSDLKITQYEQGNTTRVYNNSTGITGTIEKNTVNTTIRIYFEWDDSNTNTMDNQADTEYATQTTTPDAKIKVTINFIQKQ